MSHAYRDAFKRFIFKSRLVLGLHKDLTRREIALAKALISGKNPNILEHGDSKDTWARNEWALETLIERKLFWLFSPKAIAAMMRNGHTSHLHTPEALEYFIRHDTQCLHILGQCDAWIDKLHGTILADACHDAPVSSLETASYLLARKSDRLLAAQEFRSYAHIISHFVLKGNYGIFCWAVKEGLPILGYTPVAERLSELYDFGQLSSDCFRITYLIGCAQSAHEKLFLMKLLSEQPGPSSDYLCPEKYLHFRQLCSDLPINRPPRSY